MTRGLKQREQIALLDQAGFQPKAIAELWQPTAKTTKQTAAACYAERHTESMDLLKRITSRRSRGGWWSIIAPPFINHHVFGL